MRAIAQYTIHSLNDIITATTAPSNPYKGQLWVDTSKSPPILILRYKPNSVYLRLNQFLCKWVILLHLLLQYDQVQQLLVVQLILRYKPNSVYLLLSRFLYS